MIILQAIRVGDELSLPEIPSDAVMVTCDGETVTVYQAGDELPSQGAASE